MQYFLKCLLLVSVVTRLARFLYARQGPGRPHLERGQRDRLTSGKGLRAKVIHRELKRVQEKKELETIGDTIELLIWQWRQ